MLQGMTSKRHTVFARIAKTLFILIIANHSYAATKHTNTDPLKAAEVAAIIAKSKIDARFHITAEKAVVAQLNYIRSSQQARDTMREALKRMRIYEPTIALHLKANSFPKELLAIPLVESGYRPLYENRNPMKAAGIWQIIPSTAKAYGLKVTPRRDDRMDTQLSTQAALRYLNSAYNQFGDWKLAVVAYEYGEVTTNKLIKAAKSRDAWKLAEVTNKHQLREYLAMFDAAVIIMHNPGLVQ